MSFTKPFCIFALAAAVQGFALAGTISIAGNGSSVFMQETAGGSSSAPRSLGQTFIVPAPTTDSTLTSFQFAFSGGSADVGFDYRAYLFQWDSANTRATGQALFVSSGRTGSQVPSFTGLSIPLSAGVTYLALITTQGVVNDTFSNGLLLQNSGNVYASGQAFQQFSAAPNGNTGVGTWTSAAWSAVSGSTDFQFGATFVTPVPEPSSILLSAFGVGALALTRLRRRK